MKIAFFDTKNYDIPGFEKHAQGTGITFKFYEPRLNEDTVALAAGYDAVCVFVNDVVNAKVVDQLYHMGIKLIVLRCAGFNNVDIRACEGKISVFRVPAYSPYAVAEHAMALLLTVNRKTHKAYDRTRDFNFSLQGLTGFDLYGKTVGIIGTGKIGRIFADICKGFGMHILAYDKFPATGTDMEYVTLEELIANSDVISLHCPLTEETQYMIDESRISQMKKGVTIINTSRGGLINTEDLINGIKNEIIGAACLDVYEEEAELFYEDKSSNIIQDDKLVRLIAMPNVIITSHQAFLTKEALDNIAATTVENILRFSRGKPNPTTQVTL